MAAISDKITKTMSNQNPATTTVAAQRAVGATELRGVNLDGWQDETATHFTTYKVDAQGDLVEGSQTDWKGIVNLQSSSIVNLKRTGGAADQGNAIGDVIEPAPTAAYGNDLAEALLEHHDTEGRLKSKTVTYDHIDEKTEYKYIASPNDLNDAQFLVPGKWRFGNNQQVGSTKNLPLANNTGVMETISHSGGTTQPGTHAQSSVLQIFTTLDGRMFIRRISTAESASSVTYGAWQEFAKEKAFAAARSDVSYYQNSGANKVRTKDKIAERGNITIDTANNEFVIGEGVGLVQIAATVMTESITSGHLYLIVIHKPLGKPEKEIRQVLTEKVSSYCGASITATIKVQPGDRVYVKHDCTARIRGHTSEVSVGEI